jgi:hypothetical protein
VNKTDPRYHALRNPIQVAIDRLIDAARGDDSDMTAKAEHDLWTAINQAAIEEYNDGLAHGQPTDKDGFYRY